MRRRVRRVVRAPFRGRRSGYHRHGSLDPGPTATHAAQDIVEAANQRAVAIERAAVAWAERLIADAQRRAAEIVTDAERGAEAGRSARP